MTTIPVIILIIKSIFFFGADSYCLKYKSCTSHFFSSFYRAMIKVIYAIFTVTIKDLEVCFNKSNVPLR